MTIYCKQTTPNDADFLGLVKQLDAYLAHTDGDEHQFYNQFNGTAQLKYVIVAYYKDRAIGCGALKSYSKTCVEIKRMFTLPEYRGKGVASTVVMALEHWATQLNFSACILETGIRQVEAVAFYKKQEYTVIPNYGPYKNCANSICFTKHLPTS